MFTSLSENRNPQSRCSSDHGTITIYSEENANIHAITLSALHTVSYIAPIKGFDALKLSNQKPTGARESR